ncbi:MAG TPA: hypothetical protein VGS20_08325 [Candidatus Acidoferrales bacterium]|nr:hypothetical protein [Candidatus Acidoferrales bacterium]
MPKRVWFVVFLLAVGAAPGHAQTAEPLRLVQSVPLPGVQGRIDHFDVDVAGRRLFMSALGNNTLEVFDLRASKLVHTIRGLREPQGVTYAPESNRIFVANGDDGTCRMYDGSTFQLLNTVHLSSDADDTRYDPATRRVYVGYGDAPDAGLAVLDGTTGRLLETIRLPAHPESFQLAESGPQIYVNIPEAGNLVAVVDRNQRKIVARWTLGGAQDNFPMALDEADHRLLIGCRSPAEVLVLATRSGEIIARVPAVAHADDMWYDAARKRIYVSGGAGSITVVAQQDLTHYRAIAQVKTQAGGRTSCLAPRLDRFYLGVSAGMGRPAELRIYALQP